MGRQYTREEFAAKLGVAERGDSKLNAAADFAARLLSSPVGDSVARIVLFGSVARGEARPGSDVDVMVFGAAPRQRLMEEAAQAAWDATVEWGEQVAQLTYSLDDLFQPRSYVVYSTLKRGREIYAMDETDIRRREATAIYRKADRHLEQAQEAASQGHYELAVVGAYAAAELAAKALILLKPGVELAASHGGLIQIFSREYVKTGQVPALWGRMLNEKLELRSRALYDTVIVVTQSDTQSVLDLARDILRFLSEQLKRVETDSGNENPIRD